MRRTFDRVSAFVRSVRFRLALWFTMILALILVAFSGFVYYRQYQDVRDQTAARLLVRLGEAEPIYQRIYHDREDHGTSSLVITPGGLVELQSNEVLVLSDPGGNVVGYAGQVNDAEAGQIAQGALILNTSRSNARFFEVSLQTDAKASKPTPYIFSSTPMVMDNRITGWVILGQPRDANNQLPRLALTLVLGGGFMLFIALAGGYWLASRALWPVKAITRTAQEISETDLDRRLGINTGDELGELAGTFDRMLDRLQAAFIRQRQFTADASHELRTPLAIIGLETDRALSAGRDAGEYRRVLQVIRSENQSMTRLVGELLTLARMDAGQVTLKREPLDLSDVVLEVVERYAPLAAQKGIQIQTGDLPELPVEADRQFLSQAIGNLVDNAIKYSPADSAQWVRAETGASPAVDGSQPSAWVRISDNGPGIAPEHLPHLFDRFYRVDSARSHNPEEEEQTDQIPGSGLGLSIVQWIAKVHGGCATVQSQPGQGTSFEVKIPLTK